MADTKTTALTENADPTYEDLVFTVDDPSGTPLDRKSTWKNVLGLGLEPTIKGAAAIPYTAVEGELVLATSAGADETITVPQTPKSGDRFGVFYQGQTAGDDLIVSRGGAADNINGAAADRTLTIANEFEIYEFDGTEWWVVGQRLIPHSCRLRQTTQMTNLTQSVWTQMAFEVEDWDNAAIGAIASEDITIRRAGRYLLSSSGDLGTAGAAGRVLAAISKNNNVTPLCRVDYSATSNASWGHSISCLSDLSAGDTIELWILPATVGTADTNITDESTQMKLSVYELLDGVT